MATRQFVEQEYRMTVRFVQGYRYLDHCGEALINLERALKPGWIPIEALPKGGSIRNDTLGMVAAFNAEAVTVQQAEFLAFDTFREEACAIVDILRSTFRIDRFLTPSMMIVFQRAIGSGDADEADKALREMGVIGIPPKLHDVVRSPTSLNFTLLGDGGSNWKGVPVRVVRRVEGKVIKQVPTPPFDHRLLRRTSLLPENQKDAIRALERLRGMHPMKSSIAIQFDMELVLEGEIDKTELVLYDFLTEAREWASSGLDRLTAS